MYNFVDLFPHMQKLTSSLKRMLSVYIWIFLQHFVMLVCTVGLTKLVVFIVIFVHLGSVVVPPVFLQYFDRTALVDTSFQ